MPCRCDYLEANQREIESKRVATLLAFVLPQFGMPVPKDVTEASKNYYGDLQRVDSHTEQLCTILDEMTDEQKNKIVYDGRNANSRMLADWYDVHEQHDRIRKSEQEKKVKQAQHNALFSRLGTFSDAEIKAVLQKLEK